MLTGLCTALEAQPAPPLVVIPRPYPEFAGDLDPAKLPATGLPRSDTYQSLAARRVRETRQWVRDAIYEGRHYEASEEVRLALRALRYWQRRLVLAPVHDAMREQRRLQRVGDLARRETPAALLAAE